MTIFNHQKDRNYNNGMYIHMEYIQTFKIKVLKISSLVFVTVNMMNLKIKKMERDEDSTIRCGL